MRNRIAPRAFTLSKYENLMMEINEMMMAIKIHHYDLSTEENKEAVEKAKANMRKPSWENVVSLLDKTYRELEGDRVSPIKY